MKGLKVIMCFNGNNIADTVIMCDSMKKKGESTILPLNVLMELISRDDKTVSISELCNNLNVDPKELMRIVKILSDKGLVILNTKSERVKLSGLGLLYLRDLKDMLKA